ncbi:MAG: nitrogenase iron-molybdenum cofactor biosynthesis protein NifE, partial [Marichromatium sp.]|nr:nitrogenase iron-molybdenum cofactor biosynthesis protein NifE [Marichromatium sp.]
MTLAKTPQLDTSCTHVATKKPQCSRPTPGATTGGCAFEGAQISLFPFADAAHIVHGPMTCLGASWETRETHTSVTGRDFTQMGFTTGMELNDIIFGGEARLQKAIAYVVERYAPEAVFVYTTCVSALVGDDVDATCKAAGLAFGLPVVAVHAPGFVGSKNLGSRLAAMDVLKQLIGTKEPEVTTPFDINLIGEYNVTGDMWQYTGLLETLGIRVLSALSGDGRVANICTAHRAKLNVIVCAKSLNAVCEHMEKTYGIPYISVSFYGKRDTSDALLQIAHALGNEKLMARTKALIAAEEAALEEKLSPFKSVLEGTKAVLNTGGNKSWSIASALQDLGVEVVGTSVRKATEEDKEKAKRYLGDGGVLMENPGTEQAKLIKERGAHVLLAGGRSLYTAIKQGVAFVDVNQEKKVSYGAYNGLVNLAKDVVKAIKNTVFTVVGRRA